VQEVVLPTTEDMNILLQGGMGDEEFSSIHQEQRQQQERFAYLWASGPCSMPAVQWPSMLLVAPASSSHDDQSYFSSSHHSSTEEEEISAVLLLSTSLLEEFGR
jgi:hypothetical protein